MVTKIYGASDDLIEMEGGINDEHSEFDFDGTITGSDGTVVNLKYGKKGEWKFELKSVGDKFMRIVESVGDDKVHVQMDAIGCTSYSDVLILNEGIQWVKIGKTRYYSAG